MLVVAAAILDGDKLLACRRIAPAHLAGLYELPGGKVEPDEDPRIALLREIEEELDASIECESVPLGTWPLDGDGELVVYRASLTGARPARSVVHDDMVWLDRSSWLTGVPWVEVDYLVINSLLEN
jgi:8-oxo-dGTP diphosphatase